MMASNASIIEAAKRGDVNKVAEHISMGAHPDQEKDAMGNTALHHSAHQGHIEIVALLLKHGASANLQNQYSRTALQLAEANNRKGCAKLLKQHRPKTHGEFVASNAGIGASISNADSVPAVNSDAGDAHGDANASSATKTPVQLQRPPAKSSSAFKKLSTQELCLLMKELNLNLCARVFEELCLEGADLLELSKEEVVPMLADTGAHETKATKEWIVLKSYLRRAREAEAAAREAEAAAREAEEQSAKITQVTEDADIMKMRVKDRVTEAREHFVGRDWLAKRLLTSLNRLTPQRAVIITGIGGTGKSFFFDRLIDTATCIQLGSHWERLSRRLLARHCCMFKYRDSLHPAKFMDSVIGQLLCAIKDSGRTFKLDDKRKTPVDKFLYEHLKTPKHTEASAIAREVLLPALRTVGGAKALGDKFIMLVDSLDEAQLRNTNTIVPALVDLIQRSPGWLRWVVTSRPDADVKADIKPVEGGSIELSLSGKNQIADVREYVKKALNLPSQQLYTSVSRFLCPLVPRLEQAMAICKKAKGGFKYAVMAVQHIKEDPEFDLDRLPESVEGFYLSALERKYPGDKMKDFYKYAAPILAMLVAAFDALALILLIAAFGATSPADLRELKAHLQYLLRGLCHKRLLTKDKPMAQFTHKTVVDFFRNKDKVGDFAVDVGLGHLMLATYCRQVLKSRSGVADVCMQYSLGYLVNHLCYLHEHPYQPKDGPSLPDPLQEAARVVLDFDWLLGRLLLDKNAQGVVEEMKHVSALLGARAGDGDADLAKCVDLVQAMADRARNAVKHDPRQIMGRIMHDLSGDTQSPVVELVERARQCKRFRWWDIRGGTLTMSGEGQDLTCVGDYAFQGCSGITSLTLPEGITEIGTEAFRDCSGITSLTLPEGITEIEAEAFRGCSGITSLTLPEGITEIAGYAFRGCSGITSLTLPEGITEIGQYAFNGCTGIEAVTLPDSLTEITLTGYYSTFDANVKLGPPTHPLLARNSEAQPPSTPTMMT